MRDDRAAAHEQAGKAAQLAAAASPPAKEGATATGRSRGGAPSGFVRGFVSPSSHTSRLEGEEEEEEEGEPSDWRLWGTPHWGDREKAARDRLHHSSTSPPATDKAEPLLPLPAVHQRGLPSATSATEAIRQLTSPGSALRVKAHSLAAASERRTGAATAAAAPRGSFMAGAEDIRISHVIDHHRADLRTPTREKGSQGSYYGPASGRRSSQGTVYSPPTVPRQTEAHHLSSPGPSGRGPPSPSPYGLHVDGKQGMPRGFGAAGLTPPRPPAPADRLLLEAMYKAGGQDYARALWTERYV